MDIGQLPAVVFKCVTMVEITELLKMNAIFLAKIGLWICPIGTLGALVASLPPFVAGLVCGINLGGWFFSYYLLKTKPNN
jgi:hypothetical protein